AAGRPLIISHGIHGGTRRYTETTQQRQHQSLFSFPGLPCAVSVSPVCSVANDSAPSDQALAATSAGASSGKYAFRTYCSTIRWVLKNEPFSDIAERITS